jgi:hypothetical protein
MKKLLFLFLTAISLQISAQEFAPIGSKWHYDEGTITPVVMTFLNIESVSDTIISGISCRKLIKISRFSITPDTSYIFMYSKNDSVFFYAENAFHLLYDFSAVAGDTITLGYYKTYDGSPLTMVVDSTGTIDINGQIRTLQYVTCGDGISIEFGGIVIEGIGNINYLFPLPDNYVEGPLRCYQDSIIGLFINPYHPENGWNFQDCDQIITGISQPEPITRLNVFPNPTTHFLTITNLDMPARFKVTDIMGRTVKSGEVIPSQAINVDDFVNGIYFLEVRNSKIVAVIKIIKE